MIILDSIVNAINALSRPHIVFKPKIKRLYEGGGTYRWVAYHGEGDYSKCLECGVSGFGDSPHEAMLDFDKNWIGG